MTTPERRPLVLGLVLAGGLLAAAAAHALTTVRVDACLAKKLTASGKGAARYLTCHARAAKKQSAADPLCLTIAGSKLEVAFAKQDSKGGCVVAGDGPARNADASAYAAATAGAIGAAGACDASKRAHVGVFVEARLACYAKASGKTGDVDPACLAKASDKLVDRVAKAEAKPGCSETSQGATLLADATAFADGQACALDPTNPTCFPTPTPQPTPTVTVNPTPGICGDGFNSPDELCDASAPSGGWPVCGPDFTCVDCNCACPTRLRFAPDATDPTTLLDRGWNGLAHAQPITTGGELTYALACAATERPCGVCDLSGPIANTHAGDLRNQRCSGNLSVECASAPGGAAGCGGGLGTCEFYLGPPLPVAAGGVGICVVHQIVGPVTGTANVESGEMTTDMAVFSRSFSGESGDRPCSWCFNDPTANDGLRDGHCVGGARNGLACDAHAVVPGRPDFARTSLDCPPNSLALLGSQMVDLDATTGPESLAIAATSPACTSIPSQRCACDTCNNANADPCASNADCPPSGGNPGVCSGRRCLGGSNDGGPCGGLGGGASACPGGGSCGRPGEPTRPNACYDDSVIPGDGDACADTAPVGDHRGECPEGPPTGYCAPSSGHPQRSCFSANECCDDPPGCAADPPVPGDCLIEPRRCFLDNGLGGAIVGEGLAHPPVGDLSQPTLAAVFCLTPTAAPAVNASTGLPGPGRLVVTGTAIAEP